MEEDPLEEAYIEEALVQACEGNTLTVMGKGLGYERVVTKCVQTAWLGRKLLFVVNASGPDAETLSALLKNDPLGRVPVVVTNKFTSAERREMYKQGGCFIVTSRILVVDLLTQVAPVSRIDGVIVDKAHKVTDQSNEAFILNILHSTVGFRGFVRGFSDCPEALASKFGFLGQVMSTLGAKTLHLWPRFHSGVRSVLDKSQLAVEEVSQPLTSKMAGIQSEIVTCIDMCLGELKKVQNIDVSGLTVENGLFRSFEVTLRKQLDPVWHRVSRKTKQLVNDVGVLRRMLPDLLRFDAVSFLRIVDSIRADSSSHSGPALWMLTDAADSLFNLTKQRVYKVRRKRIVSKGVSKKSPKRKSPEDFDVPTVLEESSGTYLQLVVNVEENPKVGLLREILDEIEAQSQRPNKKRKQDRTGTTRLPGGGCTTLVFCKDSTTCEELRLRTSKQASGLIEKRLVAYLQNKFKSFCELHGLQWLLETNHPSDTDSLRKIETDLFQGFMTHSSSSSNLVADYQNNSSTSSSSSERNEASENQQEERTKIALSAEGRLLCVAYIRYLCGTWHISTPPPASAVVDLASSSNTASIQGTTAKDEPFREEDQSLEEESVDEKLFTLGCAQTIILPLVHVDSCSTILQELTPTNVVVFDPDVLVVREIEGYQARNPTRQVKLYFLQYEESVEEQKYLSDLKREQDTFRKLIEEKAGLVMPHLERQNATAIVEQSRIQDQTIIGYNLSTGEPIFASSMRRNTTKNAAVVPSVVVDMREFRSALPSMLHRSGVMIYPTTLEVGDYILSPELCVERKSIPDLHGSFNSGRIFTQAEAMCRFYSRPNLLIEFDENKPFSLQAASELTGEISSKSILAKIVLLITQFPRLRLLWSPSPTATVDLFKLMKANYGQPNPDDATRIGIPDALLSTSSASSSSASSDDVSTNENKEKQNLSERSDHAVTRVGTGEQPMGNVTAQEVLRSLPGVNVYNFGKILTNVKSLRELSNMTLEEMQSLLGKVNGKKLFDFFNQVPDSDSSDNPVFLNEITITD